MKWILIIFAHVGPIGDGNSNAMTTAEFGTQQTCMSAGAAVKRMAQGTVKSIDFVCAQQ